MSVVKYSPLCDTDSALYLSYLFCLSLQQDKYQDGGSGDVNGDGGVSRQRVVDGFSDYLAVAGKTYSVGQLAWHGDSVARGQVGGVDDCDEVRQGSGSCRSDGRVGDGSGGLDACRDDGGSGSQVDLRDRSGDSGVAVGEVSSGQSDIESAAVGCGRRSHVELGADGSGIRGGSGVVGVDGRGSHYERNKAWRERKRAVKAARRGGINSGNWRSGGVASPVVVSLEGDSSELSSSGGGKCWTVKEETGMEKRIREALEKKKAVEAELATRKAELALGRMNDIVLTELYDNRVKQEGICRMNQAIVKSEKSLENLKSVSPGSSATPGEIREALLNSEKWKCKEKKIRAWVASGHADSGIVEILDGEDDEESLDGYLRALAVEGQDEADRQVEVNRMWKNAYKTDDEIAVQENKVKAQYDARILGKVAGKRVSGKVARDKAEEVRKAQFAHDLGIAKIKDLEAQMLRS